MTCNMNNIVVTSIYVLCTVDKNTLDVKKVAWPRKTAAVTKRTNIWDYDQGLHAITVHYEKVRPIRSFNFLQGKLEDL